MRNCRPCAIRYKTVRDRFDHQLNRSGSSDNRITPAVKVAGRGRRIIDPGWQGAGTDTDAADEPNVATVGRRFGQSDLGAANLRTGLRLQPPHGVLQTTGFVPEKSGTLFVRGLQFLIPKARGTGIHGEGAQVDIHCHLATERRLISAWARTGSSHAGRGAGLLV